MPRSQSSRCEVSGLGGVQASSPMLVAARERMAISSGSDSAVVTTPEGGYSCQICILRGFKMVFSVLCFFFKPASLYLLLYQEASISMHISARSTALLKAMFHVPLLHFEHMPLHRSLHGPGQEYIHNSLYLTTRAVRRCALTCFYYFIILINNLILTKYLTHKPTLTKNTPYVKDFQF